MYEIIANNIKLDISNDVQISLNYQLEDVLDLEVRTTNWSKEIELPGTGINNQFFANIYDVNIDAETFDPLKRVETVITNGYSIMFSGYLKLNKLDYIEGEVIYYVTVYGTLNNLFNEIKGKYVSELDFSKYDHIRNKTNITNSHTYLIKEYGDDVQLDGPGKGYVYPFIIYGNNTDWINNVNIADQFPALYSIEIFRKIIENNNYTIQSKFLDNDEFVQKLINPYVKKKLELSKEEIDKMTLNVGIQTTYAPATITLGNGSVWYFTNQAHNFDRISGTVDDNGNELEFMDIDGNWTIPPSTPIHNNTNGQANTWTCPKQGYYDIALNATAMAQHTHSMGNQIEFKEGQYEYGYDIWRYNSVTNQYIRLFYSQDPSNTVPNNWTEYYTPSAGKRNSPWIDTGAPIGFHGNVDNIYLNEGDRIFFRYGFRYPVTAKWKNLATNKVTTQLLWKDVNNGEFSKFTIKPSSNTDSGNNLIKMSDVLPENWTQEDYVSDFIKMFNLVIVSDIERPNILIIEPYDDYFKTQERIKDWDLKMDQNTGYKITPMSELNFNNITITYKQDKDWLNEEYEDENRRIYGDLRIDINNDYSDRRKKIELSSSPTPISGKFLNNKVAGFFIKKEANKYKSIAVNHRFLVYGGLIPTNYISYEEYTNDPNNVVKYSYAYAGMWDHPFNPKYTLEFDHSETLYYDTDKVPTYTLFDRFYKNRINNLTNRNSRLLEAKFYLTNDDIADFDFRDVIFLRGSFWRVNEIKNFDPSKDGLTTVTLYKLIDQYLVDEYENFTASNHYTCPDDMRLVRQGKLSSLTWLYVSNEGTITKECCKSKNGLWKDGTCYMGRMVSVLDPIKGIGNTGTSGIKPVVSNGIYTSFPTYTLVGRPISIQPEGPNNLFQNNNTISGPNVTVNGTGNYVGPGINNVIISGNDYIINNPNGSNSVYADNIISGDVNITEVINDLINSGILQEQVNYINANKNIVLSPFSRKVENFVSAGKNVVLPVGSNNNIVFINAGKNKVLK